MFADCAATEAVTEITADRMSGFPPSPELQVNFSNWQQPHNVRWAFRHMREFIRTDLISAGTPGPRPLYVSLESIVFGGMATDFVSGWDKSRVSFTFGNCLVRRRGH